MRQKLLAALLFFGIVFPVLQAADEKPSLHNWERIVYVDPPPNTLAYRTFMSVTPNKENGLQLHLSFAYSEKDAPWVEDRIPKSAVVRMHLPDGKIIDGVSQGLSGVFGHGGRLSTGMTYTFPWQANVLDEAWLEVRLPKRVYWLEIPYGFTREPKAELKPAEVRSGAPKLAAAMKDMAENDVILAWRHVEYDIGVIQNDWRLTVRFANQLNGHVELELYKEHGHWDLYSPKTTFSVVDKNEVLTSGCITLHLHENDSMRRTDTHVFGVIPYKMREMLSFTAKVDDKAYTFNAPSSLIHLGHGVADPHHKALINVKPAW